MKIIKLLCCMLLCAALSVTAHGAGWYCRHTKNGEIPACPPEFAFLSEHGGVFLDTKAAESGEKVIYLTFDAGYENGNVEKTLDVLKEKGVTGAFFVLENLVTKNPELLRRMSEEGHLVCNHTAKHKNVTKISQAEIKEDIDALNRAAEEIGVTVEKFFRPPEGEIDEGSLEYINSLGYKTVMWSFAYADWDNGKQPAPAKAKEKILSGVHCGEILLLHPTSATNAAILGDVIDSLKNDGYRFGSLREIV